MSYAPRALLDVRAYLKPLTGLSDNALGIVGDEAHIGGYHHGWADRRTVAGYTHDYSWQESSRDSGHKTEAASALDIGMFSRTVGGRRVSLYDFNRWLVGECQAGAADTRDIREVIYTLDGRTVKRWDRLGKRTSGDDSHLTHTHISYHRDAEMRDKTALFRRYFEGAAKPATPLPGGELMGWFGKAKGSPVVYWMAPGEEPVRMTDGTWLTTCKPLIDRGVPLLEYTSLDALTAGTGERRPQVQPAPVDVTALAEALKPHIEVAAGAAAESAVRRVLGGLDGATPGGTES